MKKFSAFRKMPYVFLYKAGLFILIGIIFLNTVNLHAQNPGQPRQDPLLTGTGASVISAREEFRVGIHAYNRFSYNEAILALERSLSFLPGDPDILDWLGKAYYRSGFEEIALRQWRAAQEIFTRNSSMGMLIGSRIETVSNRRILLPVSNDTIPYINQGRYPGKYREVVLFRQPSSILPNKDGSVWVVAYGSNELLRIDVNGLIRDRKRGPFNGFDRPYDMARGLDGRFYVSEFRGCRVSILDSNGDWLDYIGTKGLENGNLIGPQHLTVDEEGYLYVVDYGNNRICKFDPDGVFINSFGKKTSGFQGFISPTGIAAGNGKIYIADNAAKAIYMFNSNGNYLGRLGIEGLKGPESLRFIYKGNIIAADGNKILLIETESAIVRELGLAGNEKTRITCADIDSNGNILAANFAAGEVHVMTRFDDLASGLFVQIRNINTDKFPSVVVNFTVEDRIRRPITGLDEHNFLLTERGMVIPDQTFMLQGYRQENADISILVERSQFTSNMREELTAASRDISRALSESGKCGVVSVVSAGELPRREQHEISLENAINGAANAYSSRWRFDTGLRLAATDLLPASAKRSVLYIGSGSPGDLAFEQYTLSEMTNYLANNGIVFNAVIIGGSQASSVIEYLCSETGGKQMHLYRPQGIGELIKNITEISSPLYSITFTSNLPTDFGRAWLPLELETYLMDRSGRDITGYYPPLE